jgi:hypothetical protein
MMLPIPVVPAEAKTHGSRSNLYRWLPACAGMTVGDVR